MNKLFPLTIITLLLLGCKPSYEYIVQNVESKSSQTIKDPRDNNKYNVVELDSQIWFATNLKYKSPKSKCYKNKQANCERYGRVYPSSELDMVCPDGWRVPNIVDWDNLKNQYGQDSIYALLDTINWINSTNHTNQSGLSFQGIGYQIDKKYFHGEGFATRIWLNQINKYDDYYHVHLYGGEGSTFELSGLITNEVFHAHPLDDRENRRFSVRCISDKKKE